MQSATEEFELIYNFATVKVQKFEDEKQPIYRLRFSNEVPDVVITGKPTAGGATNWDTEPAGNTELANGIGKLIEEHLKTK